MYHLILCQLIGISIRIPKDLIKKEVKRQPLQNLAKIIPMGVLCLSFESIASKHSVDLQI